MSPSKFLITKSHSMSHNVPVDVGVRDAWKVGHPKFSPYSISQLVFYKIQHSGFQTANKFTAHFRGPYSVTKVNPNNKTYEITHLQTGEVLRAHHSQLRQYNEPPSYIKSHPFIVRLNSSNDVPGPNYQITVSSTDESEESSVAESESVGAGVANDALFDDDSQSSFCGFLPVDPNNSLVDHFYTITSVDEYSNSCRCCRYELMKESGGAVDALASRTHSSLGTQVSSLTVPNLDAAMVEHWNDDDWQLSSVDAAAILDDGDGDNVEDNVNFCSNRSSNVSVQVSNDVFTTDVSTNTDNLSMHSNYSPNLLVIDTSGSGYGGVASRPPDCGDGAAEQLVLPVAGASPQLGGAVDNSFRGFLLDPTVDKRPIRLFEITSRGNHSKQADTRNVIHSDTNKPVTRSRGSVLELPNVQQHTLERRRPASREGYTSS